MNKKNPLFSGRIWIAYNGKEKRGDPSMPRRGKKKGKGEKAHGLMFI